MKLYLDPGHGGQDPGAQGNGLDEKDLTLDISLKIRKILQDEYEGIVIKMSRTGDTTKSLGERTSEANAWGADFFMAIHINSDSRIAQGYEDYIHSSLSDSSKTAKYRDIIHAEVIKVNQLKNRGKKKANFHVLRESSMPAMLSENGFIDNTHDAGLLKQASWLQKVAEGHVNGIAKAFNLKRKDNIPAPSPSPSPAPGTLYKVIGGSFKSKDHADERVALLHTKGFESFVHTTNISGETWYRVQAGAFSNRDNADNLINDLKKAGINDAFLIAE
ncbi:N-acetylmuramoyl-L-alanine amidase [Neobacillus soli]|uniref:N-acetylmuramoyl-L-alanine amidase n=1 Tax=Neobacillus soli TaxID=220688 RepID=UPI0008248438|nr:N-acetylmuramoyl-L-alanine amidase [Neobacillus soli]